ncbi:hypothetical protein TNCV_767101 [Trichonephila clavipes]|nr:hypothetical protein TNCV_767101 [Trichonephila clavipes]
MLYKTVLEAKREKFVDDTLIYAKNLGEELEMSFEPQDESGGSIYLATEVKIFKKDGRKVKMYEDDLRRTMFSSIDSNC